LGELGSKISSALRNMSNAMLLDDEVVKEMLKEIGNALIGADVSVPLVLQMRKRISDQIILDDLPEGTNKRRFIQSTVYQELINLVDPGIEPYKPVKGQANVIMAVGLQGNGKTTSVTKLAYYYQKKGWKVGLVCADTFRAGAFDQLKQNATKARIPFYGSYTETNPVIVAAEGVDMFRDEGFEIIIVDTSGRHKQEDALFDEMEDVTEAVQPDSIVFVLDASIGQNAEEQARAFKERVAVGAVIMTKMDGHAKGGGALSAVAATESPIIFLGTGEHIDQLEPFDARSFVSRLLGMGDIGGLFDKLKDAGIDQNQEHLMDRIRTGIFTLRDLYGQFESILKMGPLSSVMSMLPGFNSSMLGTNSDEESAQRFQTFLCIMDSMTNAELDSEVKFSPERAARVARGSGTSVTLVNQLLDVHKQFAKMFKKMKGISGLGKGGGRGGVDMNQLQKMMSPQMMAQMGGRQGMSQMMKSMEAMMKNGGGGFPGMPGM